MCTYRKEKKIASGYYVRRRDIIMVKNGPTQSIEVLFEDQVRPVSRSHFLKKILFLLSTMGSHTHV